MSRVDDEYLGEVLEMKIASFGITINSLNHQLALS